MALSAEVISITSMFVPVGKTSILLNEMSLASGLLFVMWGIYFKRDA